MIFCKFSKFNSKYKPVFYFKGLTEPQAQKMDMNTKAELAFDLIDKDHNGFITKSEMLKMYKNLTKEQVDALFKKSDTNHDGKLSLNEFKDMMLKNQKDKK